jgi:hypothetical protein
MDPNWEPPYKSVHQHRQRIMTYQMVKDFEYLRQEMFLDAAKKTYPNLFEPKDMRWMWTPKYVRGLAPTFA